MFVINDTDLPITVAEKIITGTKAYEANELQKGIIKVLTGEEVTRCDMFTIDEISEIATYLNAYVTAHPKGD